jgi:cardiolipin synthase
MLKARMGEEMPACVDGHALRLVTTPAERFQLILETIAQAKTSLSLMYYIFAVDLSGREVLAALIAACGRGVAVDVIVDGFGTDDQPESSYAPLVAAGARFMRFNPRYGRRYLLRNHQKMLIADGRLALIGGCNIADAYFSALDHPSTWVDLILTVEGPAAARLAAYHAALSAWVHNPDARVRDLRQIILDHSEASGPLRWLHGGLFPRFSPLTRSLRNDIDAAAHLTMQEAYFAPNWAMLRKLGHVVQRGGQCDIITAGRSNNTTTVAASRHTYHRLLSYGVRLHEYVAHRLHTKLIIADSVTYIGSANFDARSLYINVELMLRIDDASFAAQMRAWLADQSRTRVTITPEVHAARASPVNRLRWLIAYFIVSTLDYSVSRRLNIYDPW